MHATTATAPNAAPAPTGAHLTPGRRLATIEQTAKLYPFTAAALRDLVFRANDRQNSRGQLIKGNGLAKAGAVVRIGRKVLIDLDGFERWIDSHRGQ